MNTREKNGESATYRKGTIPPGNYQKIHKGQPQNVLVSGPRPGEVLFKVNRSVF